MFFPLGEPLARQLIDFMHTWSLEAEMNPKETPRTSSTVDDNNKFTCRQTA